MNDDAWSRQFYKALEVVGKLTEVEKLRLANMLIAVSEVKEKATPLKREIPPPPKPPETRQLKGDGLIPKKPVYPEKVGGYQPIKSENLGEIKSPPKKP